MFLRMSSTRITRWIAHFGISFCANRAKSLALSRRPDAGGPARQGFQDWDIRCDTKNLGKVVIGPARRLQHASAFQPGIMRMMLVPLASTAGNPGGTAVGRGAGRGSVVTLLECPRVSTRLAPIAAATAGPREYARRNGVSSHRSGPSVHYGNQHHPKKITSMRRSVSRELASSILTSTLDNGHIRGVAVGVRRNLFPVRDSVAGRKTGTLPHSLILRCSFRPSSHILPLPPLNAFGTPVPYRY
jgi:hypothetical protein